jgi:WD40 repeat protein
MPGQTADAGANRRDAAPPIGPVLCSTGPFGEPELVSGLGLDVPVFGPALSADASSLFFSAIDGDEDIFSARRTSRGTVFSAASLVPNLDVDGSEEGTPFVSADGLSLYFFSTRPGPGAQGDRDLWQARRASQAAQFVDPIVLPVVNGPALDHLPRLSEDELTLYFVSGRESPNGASNLWTAERADRAQQFSEPVEVQGVNTDAREEGFSLSSDGLTLFFASNRSSLEDMDIWLATRLDRSSAFGAAENVSVLNTTALELDPVLSADGFELFFVSSRNGPTQLFRSVRSCD